MKIGLLGLGRLLFAGMILASGVIAADFEATLEHDSAGTLVLRWPSAAGVRYRVESSTDLVTWTALPDDFVGTGSNLTKAVVPAGTGGAARTFWRVASLASGPVIPVGLLDPNLITTWNPGILADNQLGLALTERKLPTRTTVFRTLNPGDDLNAAIQACPEGSVLQLAPGRFTSPTTVMLNRGVVLRGSGSQGADAGGTTIACAKSWPNNDTVVQIGYTPAGYTADSACYDYGSFAKGSFLLTADAVKGSTTVKVGTNAAQFKAGDFALIDQRDDAAITPAAMFKREDSVNGKQVLRSISQRVEILSASGDTVTLASPLHWTFLKAKSAGLAPVTARVVKWAGVEAVRIENGTNKYYNGATAGGVEMTNTAFCWVRDVETNGALIGGIHVALHGAYRCVVRDSHLHHSAYYDFGADCYGISLIAGAADNLVENNIVRFMNKPLQFSNSGGGNVVAYNYADNAWSSPAEFQEVAVDAHCAYPHMELVEGNWAPHLALPETHGNSGYITFFRNYASSQYTYPAVVGTPTKQTANVQALSIGSTTNYVSVVGNVLGPVLNPDSRSATTITQYICNKEGVGILSFSTDSTASLQTSAYATAWLHGNYDTVNKATQWKTGNTQHTIPASLYLSAKPAWWPANSPWPWTGPDLNPMVGALPSKARADAIAP